MKSSLRAVGLFLTVALVAITASSAAAQNRERFGISAKAGGVNSVVGRVMVTRDGQAPQLLTNRDDLNSGDIVTTGSLSHVEILLNPGSYFRVGEQSEFQFQDNSLDNLRLKLLKGSAIVEATGVNDMNLNIGVVTSQASFTIIRSGVYRIDVQPNFAELAVRKGRASFGANRADIVKGGNQVTFTNGVIARAKLAKDKDDFDVWSKQRAELLARANQKLSNRVLSGYLSSFNDRDSLFWGRARWGLWTFSPRAGCYTFLPFYYGWSSPYGHYYGSYYWGGCCNGRSSTGTPIIVNNQTPGSGSTPGGSYPGGGTPPGGVPSTGPGPAPQSFPRGREPETGERIIRKNDP
jgi:hypothetical protein